MIGSKPVCDGCGAPLPFLLHPDDRKKAGPAGHPDHRPDPDLANPDLPERALFVQVSDEGNRIYSAKFTEVEDGEGGKIRVAGPGRLLHACKAA